MTDFKASLEELGYRLKDHGSYWRTNALYRAGDNSSALQVYKDTGVWKDYVEDTEFLPFRVLVEKTLNTKDNSIISPYLKNSANGIDRTTTTKNFLKEEKTYEKLSLSKLLPHYDFYIERGISEETIKRFNCGLAMSNKMYQRLVFPVFRQDGKIHGFSGRKVTNDDNRPKWLHVGRCSDWFYPYYSISDVRDSIIKQESVHIVESIGDCLSLYDNGVKNVLVSFGLNISPKFVAKLSSMPIKKIFVSFNNDFNSKRNRGFEGAIKSVFKLFNSCDFGKIYFSPPQGNDFGDMSSDEISLYIRHCESLNHKESCETILDIAEEMDKNGVNKTFSAKLKKYKK